MLGLALDMWQPTLAVKPASGPPITANLMQRLAKGTASGAVWPDASGNGRDLALVGSPTIGPSSVTFNGVSQYGTSSFIVGTPCTIYLRVKKLSATLSDRFLCAGMTAHTNHIRFFGLSGQIEANDSFFNDANGGLGLSVGAMVTLCASFDMGSGGVFSINDSPTINLDFGTGNAAMAGFVLAAASSTGTFPSNIEVVEQNLYSGVHTAPQRTEMFSYHSGL